MPDLFVSKSVEHKKPAENKEEEKADLKNHSYKDSGGAAHLFSDFVEKPQGVFFANYEADEKIVLFLRRHIVTNIIWLAKAIAASIIPFVLIIMLGFLNIPIELPFNYLLVISVFYYSLVFTYVFVSFISWFYNISLVTNERIVDIDFSQLVFESVAATKLTQVEDVSYHQVGVIRSVFDYGDVTVQTAGTASNFVFASVPHPERVVRVINNLTGGEPNA